VDVGKNVSVLDVCVLSEILVCVTHCTYHLLPQVVFLSDCLLFVTLYCLKAIVDVIPHCTVLAVVYM